MPELESTDSPLEAAAGAAGERAVEAFSVLANETRLSILLALWEAYEPFAAKNAVAFSDLRERVGMRDSGQFHYHLDKLTGHFLRKTDDGYELRRAGHQLVQTVITGTGIEEPSVEPYETDRECKACGAPAAVTYQNGGLYLICTECEGNWEEREDEPSGILGGGDFDPTGLTDRTPDQMWDAMLVSMRHTFQSGVEGVCDVCSGPMDISIDICEGHASEGRCDNCGRKWSITVRLRCPVCKNHHRTPPFWIVAWHPDVIGFYNERGVLIQYEVDHLETTRGLVGEAEQELVADGPPRVRVTYEYDGDRLAVLVDEELNVLEVTEPD